MELIVAYGAENDKVRRMFGGLTSGLFIDPDARAPIFWDDGRNVQFSDRVVKPIKGQFGIFTPEQSRPVIGLITNNIDGSNHIFFATSSGLWRWQASTGLEEVTGDAQMGGGNSDLFSFEQWGEWIVAGNGVDTPVIWKETNGTFSLLEDGVPNPVNIFVERSPFMLAFHGQEISWCDLDNVETWTSTSTNAAGNLFIRGLASNIRAALPLGEVIAFYSTNEMRLLAFRGSPFWFGEDGVLEGIGALGKASVCAVDKRHYGIGPRGIWVSDGVSFEYFASPAVHDFVFDNINRSAWGRCVAWHDALQNNVVFFYPSGPDATTPNRGVAFNYIAQTWSVYSFGRTAALDQAIFDYSLTGDENGFIYQQAVVGAAAPSTNVGGMPMKAEAVVSLGFGEGNFGGHVFGGAMEVEG